MQVAVNCELPHFRARDPCEWCRRRPINSRGLAAAPIKAEMVRNPAGGRKRKSRNRLGKSSKSEAARDPTEGETPLALPPATADHDHDHDLHGHDRDSTCPLARPNVAVVRGGRGARKQNCCGLVWGKRWPALPSPGHEPRAVREQPSYDNNVASRDLMSSHAPAVPPRPVARSVGCADLGLGLSQSAAGVPMCQCRSWTAVLLDTLAMHLGTGRKRRERRERARRGDEAARAWPGKWHWR